jgi:phosphatidylglycerophosphate synthase
MQSTVKEPYQLVRKESLPPIWGMSTTTRLSKQFARLTKEREALGDSVVVIVREDVVFDTPVLRGLMAGQNRAVVDEASGHPLAACVERALAEAAQAWLSGTGEQPVSIQPYTPNEIAGAYNLDLRKRELAACHLLTADNARMVEWKLFMTAYKGVTDFVTKYWWPRPAFHVTRWCANQGITPNQVTGVSALCVLLCLWLFASGFFWAGMAFAWVMTFLDTVDGKLARVTLTSSPLGNIFDHGIDLVHPPFWYYAWGLGLATSATPLPDGWFDPLMVLMFGGYIAGRVCEGYFMRRYGMHMYVWRRFDSRFRLFIARRNPNMVMMQLSLLIARPDWGLYAIVGWTVLSFVIQCVQVAQAEAVRASGGKITSWLDAA